MPLDPSVHRRGMGSRSPYGGGPENNCKRSRKRCPAQGFSHILAVCPLTGCFFPRERKQRFVAQVNGYRLFLNPIGFRSIIFCFQEKGQYSIGGNVGIEGLLRLFLEANSSIDSSNPSCVSFTVGCRGRIRS